MKKLVTLGICLSFALLIVSGCKKYDNGPTLSIYSKNARVDNTWILEEVLLNQVAQTLTTEDKASYMVLRQDGQATWKIDAYVNSSGISIPAAEITGKWEFGDKKETIVFVQFGKATFDILRLTNSEMWLKKMSGADIWEYHYTTKK